MGFESMNKTILLKINYLRSDSPITRKFVLGLTKALNSGRFSSGHYSDLELSALWSAAETTKSIDADLTARGLTYLRKLITKDGRPRRNKGLGRREVEIINNFSRFMFVGVIDASGGYGHSYAPLWRVESLSGPSFTYYADPLNYFKLIITSRNELYWGMKA